MQKMYIYVNVVIKGEIFKNVTISVYDENICVLFPNLSPNNFSIPGKNSMYFLSHIQIYIFKFQVYLHYIVHIKKSKSKIILLQTPSCLSELEQSSGTKCSGKDCHTGSRDNLKVVVILI